MKKPENVISAKKFSRSLTIQEQAHRKNILASRIFKILTGTLAWSFVENELQRSVCHEKLIDPLSMAKVFNKYFQMQKNQHCYNMIDGERIIDSYTGMPDFRLHYWIDTTLNAYCHTQHNGLIRPENYFAVPRVIVANAGISDGRNCRFDAPLGDLWAENVAAQKGEVGSPKKKNLLRYVSGWDVHKLERFIDNVELHKPDYSRPMSLIMEDLPLFNFILKSFEKVVELKDVIGNLIELRKRLKTHVYLLEVMSIAFYYSLVTVDEDNFLFKIKTIKFVTIDGKTGDEVEDKEIVKRVIDITRSSIMTFINIDPASNLEEMNEFYQSMFTYPAKPLFEYD